MSATTHGHVGGAPESLTRVAHDLKNQIGVVLGFTEMVLRDIAGNDPHRDDLFEIKKAGESALALTARITAIARAQERT